MLFYLLFGFGLGFDHKKRTTEILRDQNGSPQQREKTTLFVQCSNIMCVIIKTTKITLAYNCTCNIC
jgi:hypothetical protein